MPKVPRVNHQDAIRAFEKIDFVVVRQSGHIVMRKDQTIIVIPRQNPIKAFTMGDIIKVAGITVEDFRSSCGS